MKKILSYIITASLVIGSAVSCIYPFEPDIPELTETVVIEGDIRVGSVSHFNVSFLQELGSKDPVKKAYGRVYVEDDQGQKYEGTTIGTIGYTAGYYVDLTEASPDRKYRLCVIVPQYDSERLADYVHEYQSDFLTPLPAPVIDGITYIESEDKTKVDVCLSFTSTEGNKYFKWDYIEDWEYHAPMQCKVEYIPPAPSLVRDPDDNGQIVNKEVDTYWCWTHKESSENELVSVMELTADKVVEHKFLTIGYTDLRIQSLYRMTVQLDAISADGYAYWKNLQEISDYHGSLDTPNPSQIAGNVHCVSDPTEFVIGYINASIVATAHEYYDGAASRIYEDKNEYTIEEGVQEVDWYKMYQKGLLPVEYKESFMTDEPSGWTWASKRCTDCRASGGTKNKPADWPTKHE